MSTLRGNGERRRGCVPGPEVLAQALVAALEQAMLAARCLLAAMEAAGRHPGASANTPCASPVASALNGPPCVAFPANRAMHAMPAQLSRREAEVLGLLAAGRSNRDIAEALCLSPRTVQRHVANAYLKIGAHCRAEATAFAIRHGLC